MHILYQAGPLFTRAEIMWHKDLTLRLERAGYTVIWPGALLTDEQIREAGEAGPGLIYETCRSAIDRCTAMVALLDGPQVDDGTAWEIGYAHAKGIPVYGIRTDLRRAGETPHSAINSVIQGSLAGLASTPDELLTLLRR